MIHRLSPIIVILVLALFSAEALAKTKYDLKVELQEENATLAGTVKVSYQNKSGQPLKSLLFRLDANQQAKMRIQEVKAQDGLILPAHFYKYPYLGRTLKDHLLYQVHLPSPLKPLEDIELTFKYTLERLPHADRTFFLLDDPNRLGLGAWYPRIVSHKNGRWQPTIQERANYSVAAKSNKKLYAISPSSAVSLSKSDWAYHYDIEQSQSLDLIFTPNLIVRSAQIEDLPIRYYYPAQLQKSTASTLKIIKDILAFYKARYGVFPVKQLTIIATEKAKFPVIASSGLVVISHDFPKDVPMEHSLKERLAYGIAQEYWGIRVKESGEHLPWLSQGLSLYLAQRYLQSKNELFPWGKKLTQDYLKIAKQGWNTSLKTPLLSYQKMPFDSFGSLAQGKGYTIFRLLDNLLGQKILSQAEIKLQKTLLHQTLTENKLINAVQSASNKELGWFFQQWAQSNQVLDYAVQSVQVSKTKKTYQVTIGVQRLGEAIMPVSLSIKLKNGEQVFKLWDGEQRSEILQFEVSAPVEKVTLDSSQVTPDIHRENNSFSLD